MNSKSRSGVKIAEPKRDLACALMEAGKTYREIAVALDISVGSVHNIVREPTEITGSLVEHIKKRVSTRNYLLSEHILSAICDGDIIQASLMQKVTASAILIEKARLTEGLSTANIASTSVSYLDVTKGIEDIQRRLRRLERGIERSGIVS